MRRNEYSKETGGIREGGSYDGLIAPEARNNAIVGGSLIPLLTLGIPGSAPAAVLGGPDDSRITTGIQVVLRKLYRFHIHDRAVHH